jgi:hypothetical protein
MSIEITDVPDLLRSSAGAGGPLRPSRLGDQIGNNHHEKPFHIRNLNLHKTCRRDKAPLLSQRSPTLTPDQKRAAGGYRPVPVRNRQTRIAFRERRLFALAIPHCVERGLGNRHARAYSDGLDRLPILGSVDGECRHGNLERRGGVTQSLQTPATGPCRGPEPKLHCGRFGGQVSERTRYVVDLVARDTVNTMPAATLQAVSDHGVVQGDAVRGGYDAAWDTFDELGRRGIDTADVAETLERRGIATFEKSWNDLIVSVTAKLKDHGPKQVQRARPPRRPKIGKSTAVPADSPAAGSA